MQFENCFFRTGIQFLCTSLKDYPEVPANQIIPLLLVFDVAGEIFRGARVRRFFYNSYRDAFLPRPASCMREPKCIKYA